MSFWPWKIVLSGDQDFSDEPKNIATLNDNGCLVEDSDHDAETVAASVLVSIALATYAAMQDGDAHG
jgi:hypothetical protein